MDEGDGMPSWVCTAIFVCLATPFAFTSHAATLAGVIKGPDNREFRAAFVNSRNLKRKFTVAVLSDDAGHFRFSNLEAGDYEVSIRAAGYRVEPALKVILTESSDESLDISLQENVVRWSEISIYQGMELFPLGIGRDQFFENCTNCHAFQTRIAAGATRDVEGWQERVKKHWTTLSYALGNLSERDVESISYYISQLFGPDSIIEKSPEDRLSQDLAPGYKETLQRFSSDSLNIVYVEFDLPPPGRFPISATPDNLGNIWIPNGAAANKITRLQPELGMLTDFPVPGRETTGIHSLISATDGSIWFAERAKNTLGKWDASTKVITEFPGKAGASKRTVRLDVSGNVWASGAPLTRFEPKTGRFTSLDSAPDAYDVELDHYSNAWFIDPATNRIGRVDSETLNVSQWELPTVNAEPRNLQIAPDGMIWIAEFRAARLARFDPETETFKEYALSGRDPTPTAMEFDADGTVWYSSFNTDTISRFDPGTGETIHYPCPHSEMTIHEFHRDPAGRIWYGSAANNKVGYFYLSNKIDKASIKELM